MKIELKTEALEAVCRLCDRDALEANIALMEDTIDHLLEDSPFDTADEKIDYVTNLRRISKMFQTILKSV